MGSTGIRPAYIRIHVGQLRQQAGQLRQQAGQMWSASRPEVGRAQVAAASVLPSPQKYQSINTLIYNMLVIN